MPRVKFSAPRFSRRRFVKASGALLASLATFVSGCASLFRPESDKFLEQPLTCAAPGPGDEFDYIIVGSGAGGGPLAAKLALAGYKVLLLEAGGEEDLYDYEVPAFHARASEDERFAWNFFVRHYGDDERQKLDPKFIAERNGVLYPRCATLGGCTAHNAMVFVYPHNSDWDYIAQITGDASWSSDNMRRYFERLEYCEYADPEDKESRHGFRGWLATNVADRLLIARDQFLQALTAAMALESFATLGRVFTRALGRVETDFDPNDWRLVKQSGEGICTLPLTTHKGRRAGSRDYILRAQRACSHLQIRTRALVSRIVLDDNLRATGVEYLSGTALYRADSRYRANTSVMKLTATVKREVVVCAGAFNTPQLLKLSGIGPRAELERHDIPVRVERPGVGENLQDRYEVSVVTKMREELSITRGMKFRPPQPGEEPDPSFEEWLCGAGPYTTNGSVVAFMKRSFPERPEPDLFIFGLIGSFRGYFPGYSQVIGQDKSFFTWAVLKAHTNNTAGRVILRSGDPRDVPDINFHYFDEGIDRKEEDLAAVVEGVQTVRRINARCRAVIDQEIFPGNAIETPEQIRQFIKNNAWGHHASCSCKMGASSDALAVVDSNFKVYGTRNLRVVDASIFPRIPGFFIASSVYMISEKAADVILQDAKASAT